MESLNPFLIISTLDTCNSNTTDIQYKGRREQVTVKQQVIGCSFNELNSISIATQPDYTKLPALNTLVE